MNIIQIKEQQKILTEEKEENYQKLKKLQEIGETKENEILDNLTNTFEKYNGVSRIGVDGTTEEHGPYVELQIENYLLKYCNNEITILYKSSVAPVIPLTDTLIAKIKEDINNTLSYL